MPATLPEIVAPEAEVGGAGAAELEEAVGDAGELLPHAVAKKARAPTSVTVFKCTVASGYVTFAARVLKRGVNAHGNIPARRQGKGSTVNAFLSPRRVV